MRGVRLSASTVTAALLLLALGTPSAPAGAVQPPPVAAGVPAAAPTEVDPAGPIAPPVLVPLVGGALPDSSPAGESPTVPATAGPGVGAALDPGAVADVLAPLLSGGALGAGATPAHVVDVASGRVLYSSADDPTLPASTMKLVTAVSVLDALGADAVLRTRTAILDPTATTPRVVLIGGGDPSLRSTGSRVGGSGTSLTPASVQELAGSTARALGARGIGTVRIGYDASLFTGPALHPTWPRSFPAAGIVAPVSALQVDQGRRTPTSSARVPDPAVAAARVLAQQLEVAGVKVRGRSKEVEQRQDSVPLASVSSPPVGVLVERALATSDNDYAEALARLAAHGAGLEASFDGVATRAAAVMDGLGLVAEGEGFADGSGLSRRNALTPSSLTGLLRVTSTRFGEVASGLPVAGATGSLRGRYGSAGTRAARGVIRAKTGTLTGVVGLAGYASRPDGRLLAFAFLDDSSPGGAFASRAAVDRAAAALVVCDCAAPESQRSPEPRPSP